MTATTVRDAARLTRRLVAISPRYFATAVAGAALFAVCTVASSLGVRWMVDRVILPRFAGGDFDGAALAGGAAIVVGIGVLRAVGVVVRRSFAGMAEWRTAQHLADGVLERLAAQPVAWHRRHMVGDLVARCGVDVDAAVSVMAPMPFSSSVVVLMVVAAGYLLATDLVLGGLATALFPLMLAMNLGYQRRVDRHYADAQRELGLLSEAVHESFDGVMVVKAFGAEDRETARLAEITGRLRDARVRAVGVRSLFESLLDAVPSLANVALLALGAVRVRDGAMSVGDLASFLYLFTLLAFPLRIIGYLFSEVPHSIAGWRRVAEVADAPVEADPRDAIARTAAGTAVAMRGVVVAHGDGEPILRGVDLALPVGTTTALVGATGSGKTTLLHALAGLIPLASGSVAVASSRVGLVFQEPFLFADTLRFNLTLGDDVPEPELWAALEIADADAVVRELEAGLETELGERGVGLSGGQRQRIALARALARGADLLLLDDTTSALDPMTESRVLGNLRGMTRRATVLVVASRPSTIALADRVAFLRDGVVAALGTHDELLDRRPDYRELLAAFETDRREGAT